MITFSVILIFTANRRSDRIHSHLTVHNPCQGVLNQGVISGGLCPVTACDTREGIILSSPEYLETYQSHCITANSAEYSNQLCLSVCLSVCLLAFNTL